MYLKIHQKRDGSIPEEVLGCITQAIINALVTCKKKSIIHRNVKPSNIFLNFPTKQRDFEIKLGDFGESGFLTNNPATSYAGEF